MHSGRHIHRRASTPKRPSPLAVPLDRHAGTGAWGHSRWCKGLPWRLVPQQRRPPTPTRRRTSRLVRFCVSVSRPVMGDAETQTVQRGLFTRPTWLSRARDRERVVRVERLPGVRETHKHILFTSVPPDSCEPSVRFDATSIISSPWCVAVAMRDQQERLPATKAVTE